MSAHQTTARDLLADEIDDVVATCNGDLRGALRALLLINEQLERELQFQRAFSGHVAPRVVAADAMH